MGGGDPPPVAPSLPTRYPARGDVVLLGAPMCAHSRMRDLVTSCFVRGYVASHKTHVLNLSTGDRAPRRLRGPNVLRDSRSTRGSAIFGSFLAALVSQLSLPPHTLFGPSLRLRRLLRHALLFRLRLPQLPRPSGGLRRGAAFNSLSRAGGSLLGLRLRGWLGLPGGLSGGLLGRGHGPLCHGCGWVER